MPNLPQLVPGLRENYTTCLNIFRIRPTKNRAKRVLKNSSIIMPTYAYDKGYERRKKDEVIIRPKFWIECTLRGLIAAVLVLYSTAWAQQSSSFIPRFLRKRRHFHLDSRTWDGPKFAASTMTTLLVLGSKTICMAITPELWETNSHPPLYSPLPPFSLLPSLYFLSPLRAMKGSIKGPLKGVWSPEKMGCVKHWLKKRGRRKMGWNWKAISQSKENSICSSSIFLFS